MGLAAFLLALIHPSAWNWNSRKFGCKILHSPAPIPLQSPLLGSPFGPAPLELVTPVYRYASQCMGVGSEVVLSLAYQVYEERGHETLRKRKRSRACYERGRKSHRNADSTVGLVPPRSTFPAFL